MVTEQAPYCGHCQGKMVVINKLPEREGSVVGTERQLMTNKLTGARGMVKIAVWLLNKHLTGQGFENCRGIIIKMVLLSTREICFGDKMKIIIFSEALIWRSKDLVSYMVN